ncbi:MAG: AAA+-type ATPase [Thelocarpon superellum]|nr:MAG: AAA+-type ATPase [Thelocarpon superellum]
MILENLEAKSIRRSFRIHHIDGDHSIAQLSSTIRVHILPPSVPSNGFAAKSLEITPTSIGGLRVQIERLNKVLKACDDPLEADHSWFTRPAGLLLYGAKGTGKTMILDRIAATSWGTVFRIDFPRTAMAIRKTFAEARKSQRSIIIFDHLETLISKGGAPSGEGDAAVVLSSEMKCLNTSLEGPQILVVGATNRIADLDETLRSPGPFEFEIEIPIPDAVARVEILKSITKTPPDAIDPLLEDLGQRSHGYTGADLRILLRTANCVDVDQAMLRIRPSAMREIFLEVPAIKWSDIGGQEEIKRSLTEAVEWPIKYPARMHRLGIEPKKGLLLYGPPGCSKTLTAKALATEAGFNFIAVKGPELLSMYVGESERALRNVFEKARAASPSIIFFDEIDTIASRREDRHSSGLHCLETLLNEMDGIETLNGVFVLAATNKPDMLDTALLRPGRFDSVLYVGPPDLLARRDILRAHARKMDIDETVDIDQLAQSMDGHSGAEIVEICKKAGYLAFHDSVSNESEVQISHRHFDLAMDQVPRQISPGLRQKYERWRAGGFRDDDSSS